ncbi:DUF4178 domain-containing protein [Caldimonas sp. KR1-144]|uniref:DUF4178 domain-containing protein n=1 Tax=Caldimonas sp. KR1-144 TaxID=3400911 RepID=UPI003C067AAF
MASPSSSPQRAWRAACPNCGAPVEFRSAASASAVCGFCKSTLLREGEALRRIGRVGELFDDHSPLALGTQGRFQGEGFVLVGRLQYRYDGGTWNEWRALFDSGRSGWLSEDNGAFVFSFDAPLDEPAPPADELVAGERRLVAGQAWDVASVTRTALIAAEGELAKPPNQREPFVVADLRNAQGEVATLDYGDAKAVGWSVGRPVELSALSLVGLAVASDGAEVAEKTLAARALDCPSCGAALEVTLASTQSIVCHQCKAVVDVSQGAGADLAAANRSHYGQDTPGSGGEPLIPLGATGSLGLGGPTRRWQVVGYVERHTVPGPGDDGESWFWREYLLYHRGEGFAFLVDAEDGWSWVRTISGAPQRVDGSRVKWRGVEYRMKERYIGEIGYVLGEFYWKLERGARTDNTDYTGSGANAKKRLNREQTAAAGTQEVTWSAGETLDADAVLSAFGLGPERSAAFARDAQPVAGRSGGTLAGLFVFLLLVVLVFAMVRCSRDDCRELRQLYGEASSEYQQCQRSAGSSGGSRGYGGSFGGFSSGGGGHK